MGNIESKERRETSFCRVCEFQKSIRLPWSATDAAETGTSVWDPSWTAENIRVNFRTKRSDADERVIQSDCLSPYLFINEGVVLRKRVIERNMLGIKNATVDAFKINWTDRNFHDRCFYSLDCFIFAHILFLSVCTFKFCEYSKQP